jgi:chemotaxis protein MotB
MLHPERGGRNFTMFRRIKTETDQGTAQWQTIYCSLMMLLVVFFVMLTAYSSIDSERMTRLQVIKKVDPKAAAKPPGIDEAMQSLEQMAHDFGADVAIRKTSDGFKAVIPNPVLFASGDAALSDKIYPILDGIVAIAKKNNLAVQVEGHTDNVPIETQKFPSNWELSTTRAVNILRYMQTNSGVPANRLVAVGFAEYRPIADNGTPEGRRENRRIEIIFRQAT